MEWATAIRDLLANNAGLPYSDLSAVENQLSSLELYHFHLGISQFSYKDGSSKTLIGFSGLIESRKKHHLAIVGWLTPDFPRAPPDIYLLAKYDEVLEANHQWVRPCGKVDIPYLQRWKNHSTLSILIVELVGAFGSWPPFIKRRNNKLPPSVSSTKIPEGITDKHLRKALKNLLSDFPEFGVQLCETNVSTLIPLITGYIPITYHGKNYKVQIQIQLARYPHQAPQVYILWDRTKSCIREDSQYVSSTTGLVHIPLLQNWPFRLGLEDYCTLVGLVWNMVGLFSLHPPVRSGICVPSNSGTTSNSNEEKREEENTEGAGSDYERQQKDSENELMMFESSGWRGFFDVTALKKISQEHPTACLRTGALMAVLSYLDFFSTGVQRVALSTAVNMCKKLPSDAADFVMEAVPLLTNLLQYHDAKVLEHASVCLTRIAESFAPSPDKLDELCNHGLVAQSVSLISTSNSGGGQSSVSTPTYRGLIRLLSTCASGSPLGAKTLLSPGITGILKDVLSGSGSSSNTTVSPALSRPAEQPRFLRLSILQMSCFLHFHKEPSPCRPVSICL